MTNDYVSWLRRKKLGYRPALLAVLGACLAWHAVGRLEPEGSRGLSRAWRLVLVNEVGAVVAAAAASELGVMQQLATTHRGLAVILVMAQPVFDGAAQLGREKDEGSEMAVEPAYQIPVVTINTRLHGSEVATRQGTRQRQRRYG